MALLRTPTHDCSVVYATPAGATCRQAAYRRNADGDWMCKVHLRADKARRKAKEATDGTAR
jgi:hypothetical protein